MSPISKNFRQGLPRVLDGDPWPPVTEVALSPDPVTPPPAVENTVAPQAAEAVAAPEAIAEPVIVAKSDAVARPEVASSAPTQTLRQGLPRVVGAEPWPPTNAPVAPIEKVAPVEKVTAESTVSPAAPAEPEVAAVAVVPESTVVPTGPAATDTEGATVRQGLPRVAGGDPWPPSTFLASTVAATTQNSTEETTTAATQPEPAVQAPEPSVAQTKAASVAAVTSPAPAASPTPTPTAAPTPTPAAPAPAPAPAAQTAKTQEKPPAKAPASTPSKPATTEPKRHGPLTSKQWVLAGVLGAFCALGIATAVVLVARGITNIEAVASFIQRYPGEYHLPASAPIGVPAWLAWNHFFNFFLMVLIIRSGLLVRHQKKPPAYWSSKRSPKVSINLWLHQSLDLLWIINGLIFVIVLFASGHWMRIVPTSWEVFPNAISAALQYLTLDWPTENGWVNYNSLQQLAYFITVFIAAPLAAITGFRLSAYWPKNPALSKKYPIEWARAVHFPTMIYFVLFILIHVILVFSTGALRNLNHMYAAQGSTDPTAYADNWAGLLFFALSLLIIIGAWLACSPVVLASIARFFGKVSSR